MIIPAMDAVDSSAPIGTQANDAIWCAGAVAEHHSVISRGRRVDPCLNRECSIAGKTRALRAHRDITSRTVEQDRSITLAVQRAVLPQRKTASVCTIPIIQSFILRNRA